MTIAKWFRSHISPSKCCKVREKKKLRCQTTSIFKIVTRTNTNKRFSQYRQHISTRSFASHQIKIISRSRIKCANINGFVDIWSERSSAAKCEWISHKQATKVIEPFDRKSKSFSCKKDWFQLLDETLNCIRAIQIFGIFNPSINWNDAYTKTICICELSAIFALSFFTSNFPFEFKNNPFYVCIKYFWL